GRQLPLTLIPAPTERFVFDDAGQIVLDAAGEPLTSVVGMIGITAAYQAVPQPITAVLPVGSSAGRQVAQTLQRFGGIDDVALIPHDLASFDAALLAGQTLREGTTKSPARAALSAIVTERILPPKLAS